MSPLYRFVVALLTAFALAAVSAPVRAKYFGADPPLRCSSTCGTCANTLAAGPTTNCSTSEQCASGTCFSRTEGNQKETYRVVSVRSANGAQLDFKVTYSSYNADTSRARFDTVLGIGWTHSYNLFLFSVRGHMFRVDGNGRITKYQLGAGGTFTAAAGYFEKIVKNADGSFTITHKDQTAHRFEQVSGTSFMPATPVWRLTRITDRNNNVTSLDYSGGNLVSVTDTYGRRLTFSYNAQKRIAGVTDPLARTTTFTYDATGTQLLRITDPAGRAVQYAYNFLWQITAKVDKDGRTYRYSYTSQDPTGLTDSTGAPYFSLFNPLNWATDETVLARDMVRQYIPATTSKTDGRGTVWRYDYDQRGYVTRMIAPDSATWTYTYDPLTLMPASETDANGRITRYQYDSRGNLVTKTDPLGNVTTYTYEPVFNQMTSLTDANGRTTSYAYDARGNRIQETDPLAQTRVWTYDSHGNVLTERDKRGNLTRYIYDAFGNRVQRTDPLGNLTRMSYDAVGNLVSRTDANNHTTTYTYDALDRLTRETDPAGKTTTYVYDGQGNRTQVTDRNGNTTRYQYDQRNRLIQTTDALGQSTKYTYDNNNNRLSVTDKNNRVTRFSYDVQNRLTQIVDALGNTSTLQYDLVGNKVRSTDANARSTTYTYDALNRLVIRTDPVGNVTRMAYDTTGPCAGCTGPTKGSNNVTKRTDGNGKVTYFKYDGLDRLVRQVRKQGDTADNEDANDAVTVYTYDANNNRLTLREPNGNITTYVYDALDRHTRETNAAGDVTTMTYDGVGNVITVTAPTTNVIRYTYDVLDRVSNVRDSGGTLMSYTYDAVGNRLTQTDGNSNTTRTAYDAIYRIVQTTDALGKTTSFTYDAVGNQLSMTDRNANATRYAYDAINRRVSMTDALGNITQYQYDGVGNLTRLTDANAHATTYAYDGVNRRVRESYADGFSRSYGYDFVSNLTSRTDQNGRTTAYSYSDLYFLVKRTYPVSSADNMTYDLSGRMLSAERGGWLATFAYDGANRVTGSVQNGKTLTYSYNIPGRTRALIYPGGRMITERMDIRSRLASIDDASPNLVQYSYDAGNRVLARAYRNGSTATYSYNANDWITALEHSVGGVRIAGFGHDYDNEGNKRFEEKRADAANSQTKSEAYQYDNIYRLIDYKVGTLSGSTVPVPATQTQYTLDPVGNWNVKTKDAIPETRTHNAVNEITSINGAPLAYDNNGNLTEDTVFRYAYDEENRLTAVQRKSDSAIVGQYQYDALSRRVQKVANPAATPTTTRYFYDDARIVEEQNTSGATQATYVYGSYIDEVLTMDRGAQTFFYHQNALWSVEAITNSAATVVERYSYDAYGLPAILSGTGAPLPLNAWGTAHSAIQSSWTFTGRQLDEESGLYFYRARYYDSVKGRFLQRDPLGYVDGLNLYAYVANAPVNRVDPTGTITSKQRDQYSDPACFNDFQESHLILFAADLKDKYKESACFKDFGESHQILYAFCRTMVDVALAPIDKITKPCDVCNKMPEALKDACKRVCDKVKEVTIGRIADALCCDQIKSTEIPLFFCRDRLIADPSWGRQACLDCCEKLKEAGKVNDTNRMRCRERCNKQADLVGID
jgi:RHS repeat-associated protein